MIDAKDDRKWRRLWHKRVMQIHGQASQKIKTCPLCNETLKLIYDQRQECVPVGSQSKAHTQSVPWLTHVYQKCTQLSVERLELERNERDIIDLLLENLPNAHSQTEWGKERHEMTDEDWIKYRRPQIEKCRKELLKAAMKLEKEYW